MYRYSAWICDVVFCWPVERRTLWQGVAGAQPRMRPQEGHVMESVKSAKAPPLGRLRARSTEGSVSRFLELRPNFLRSAGRERPGTLWSQPAARVTPLNYSFRMRSFTGQLQWRICCTYMLALSPFSERASGMLNLTWIRQTHKMIIGIIHLRFFFVGDDMVICGLEVELEKQMVICGLEVELEKMVICGLDVELEKNGDMRTRGWAPLESPLEASWHHGRSPVAFRFTHIISWRWRRTTILFFLKGRWGKYSSLQGLFVDAEAYFWTGSRGSGWICISDNCSLHKARLLRNNSVETKRNSAPSFSSVEELMSYSPMCWLVGSDKLCRGPLRGNQKCHKSFKN